MSFEIARRIVQSYRQSNEERIKNSMQMAYQEALNAFKSEQAAREAALEVLNNQTKIFDTMLKDINKSRQQILMGEQKKAQKILEIRQRNLIGEERTKDTNAMRKYRAQAKQEMRDYGYRGKIRRQKFQEDVLEATTEARIKGSGKGLPLKESQAAKFARQHVLADDLTNTQISEGIDEVATAIREGKNPTAIINKLEGTLSDGIDNFLSEKSKTGKPLELSREEGFDFRKADLSHFIMTEIANKAGLDKVEQLEQVKKFLYDPDSASLKKRAGKFFDVESITPELVDQEYQNQQRLWLESQGVSGGDIGARGLVEPLYIEPPPRVGAPPEKRFIPETEPELLDMSIGRELRNKAQPVFNALRNDYVIDAIERKEITPESLQAYQQLQELIISNPLAVTKEEQLLLDESTLRQQRDILQQQERVSAIRPQLAEPERIKARAAEIAEPEQKFDPNQFTPTQQKYFATERKAYELSEKSDNDIRNMGVPEKFGLSLWQETFDAPQRTFVQGSSYDKVLSRLGEEFQDKPEEYMRALSAYNSRAMALQKSSNPVILPDGKKNTYWLESLKALAPKSE